MRVGIDVRTVVWNRFGGLATYATNLVEQLAGFGGGMDLVPFAPIPGSVGPVDDPVVIRSMTSLHAFHLPTGPTRAEEEAEAAELAGAIRAHRIDVYHVPQNGIGMPGPVDCPVVITLHDVTPLVMPEGVHPRYVEVFKRRGPAAAARAGAIATDSEFSKAEICRTMGVDPSKVRVVPLAAGAAFRPDDPGRSRAAVGRAYGLVDDYALYVGGFNRRKNVVALLESFAIASHGLPRGARLALVGDPSTAPPEVAGAIGRLGLGPRVAFLGRPPAADMPDLYRAARLFIYPSLYEGFGLPPLEAMSCGVPSIVSDAASLPEVVGDGAILVDARDPARIAECIRRLWDDGALRADLIGRGLRRSRHFSWEKTASMTIEVYRAAARRRGG